MSYCVTFVNRDIPHVYAISADELRYEDIFRLEKIHNVNPKNFEIYFFFAPGKEFQAPNVFVLSSHRTSLPLTNLNSKMESIKDRYRIVIGHLLDTYRSLCTIFHFIRRLAAYAFSRKSALPLMFSCNVYSCCLSHH